jgi:hypothetical protein
MTSCQACQPFLAQKSSFAVDGWVPRTIFILPPGGLMLWLVMSSPFGCARDKLRRDIWIPMKLASCLQPDPSARLRLGRDDKAFRKATNKPDEPTLRFPAGWQHVACFMLLLKQHLHKNSARNRSVWVNHTNGPFPRCPLD